MPETTSGSVAQMVEQSVDADTERLKVQVLSLPILNFVAFIVDKKFEKQYGFNFCPSGGNPV